MLRSLTAVALCLSLAVPASSQAQGSDEDGLTINVRGQPLGQVLEMISVKKRVNIVAGVDTNVPVTVNFYDASLEEALDWVLTPVGYGWIHDGKVYTVMNVDDLDLIERPLVPHLIVPNYRTARELEAFLIPLLSPQGRIVLTEPSEVGIPSGSEDGGGDSATSQDTLLIIDNADAVERMRMLVARFDVFPRQVLVEATILEVFLDETNRMGVDFHLLLNGEFGDFGSLNDPSSVYSSGGLTPSGTGSLNQNGFTEGPGSDGLRVGYVGNNFALFMEALQEVADANVLANPKVLALNKQRAEIIIGERLGYFGATTVSDGISQQSVEFLETGVQLRFRPFIGDDGYVRLEIHPQRSSGKINPVTGLPDETTTEVTTNVMIKNNETVVIGGLIEQSETEIISRVPVLGYLPGLKWLFSSEETTIRRKEIVILLTPHILENGAQHAEPDGRTGAEIVADHRRDRSEFIDHFGAEARVSYAKRLFEDAATAFASGQLDEARMLCDRALMLDPLAEGGIDLSMDVDRAIAERDAGGNAWDQD